MALAGDAAHLMPPWAGQGMNTGIRDVSNLCWKLAAIVTGEADRSLLYTYESERVPHAKAVIDLSTTLGRVLSPTSRSVARARDWFLRAVSVAPSVKRWTVEMRFKPIPHYRTGFVHPERPGHRTPTVGRMLVQHMVETADGAHVRLDEVLGSWFAIVGFERDPLAACTENELAMVDRFRPRVVKIVESRAGARPHRQHCVADGTLVVEDVHNELRPWFDARHGDVALVRPDRYVAAMSAVDDSARWSPGSPANSMGKS